MELLSQQPLRFGWEVFPLLPVSRYFSIVDFVFFDPLVVWVHINVHPFAFGVFVLVFTLKRGVAVSCLMHPASGYNSLRFQAGGAQRGHRAIVLYSGSHRPAVVTGIGHSTLSKA